MLYETLQWGTNDEIQHALLGTKKAEVEKGAKPEERLLISPPLLLRMKAVWELLAEQPDTKMLWAAATWASLLSCGLGR